MDNHQAWERQQGETTKAWAAFQLYRDMGLARSHAKVAIALGKELHYRRTLEQWASQYNWSERCREYDAYVDKINRSFREETKLNEYARRIEAYRDEVEQVGRALLRMGILQMRIVERELNTRLRNPEKLAPHELANMMRSSAQAIDIGTRLIAEALGVDSLADLLADTVSPSQRN